MEQEWKKLLKKRNDLFREIKRHLADDKANKPKYHHNGTDIVGLEVENIKEVVDYYKKVKKIVINCLPSCGVVRKSTGDYIKIEDTIFVEKRGIITISVSAPTEDKAPRLYISVSNLG